MSEYIYEDLNSKEISPSPIQCNNDNKQTNDDNDIIIDNNTNTKEIEQKINRTTPFFLDLDLTPHNEISHPHQKRKKNKKANKK